MPTLVEGLLETARGLRDRQVGILLVEQKLEAALHVADRVAFMEDGAVVHQARPDDLAAHPDVIERYLGVRQ
jgi:ABC-type branched-subunit amino acid transport system ATPase component